MSLGPLMTERLMIRRPAIGDADALHQRRNHPDAARYQDWTVPYSVDTARRTTAAAATMDGPADGEWWMLTIVERQSGRLLGDVAIGQSWQGRAAEIGYTLHPDHWGNGFGREAVGATIDALIQRGVHRLSATTHPHNWASIRLLEWLGFEYEGRSVEAYFDGDGPKAGDGLQSGLEGGDGLQFGLTATGRSRWLDRPMGQPGAVDLVEIGHHNQREVGELRTHFSQEDMVAPVLESYGDALFPPVIDGVPVQPWLRAIEIRDHGEDDPGEDDDEDGNRRPMLAGFVMLAEPSESWQEPYLWRLLIDREHQRRGIGSAALDQIEDRLALAGHETIRVHWGEGPGSPEAFYRGRGYEPTGRVQDGEAEGRKRLS